MARGRDLNSEVRKILQEQWSTRLGRKVPEPDELGLGNDAVKLEGTVLYADLNESTKLVDTQKSWFAAEVYKSYLVCAARVIRSENAQITAYDGDRIMAVFVGKTKNERAVKAALKINYAVNEIVNPALRDQYPSSGYSVTHVVGIDTSELFVARTGMRGANDLVWVGRAANHAAKLAGRDGAATQITSDIYNQLPNNLKIDQNGQNIWNSIAAVEVGQRRIYTSSSYWSL